MLMRTSGGKADRSAERQDADVLPVVKPSSIRRMWRMTFRCMYSSDIEKAPETFLVLSSTVSFVWVAVRLQRLRMSVLRGIFMASATPSAITSA